MEVMKLTRTQLTRIIKESLSPAPVIYCDMDGVLVDFAQGAAALINSVLDGTRQDLVDTSKSIRKALRRIHRDLGQEWRVTSGHDLEIRPVRSMMMSAIGKRAGEYFRDLPPMNDGISKLWPFINSLGLQVNILSAPIQAREGITAEEGKYLWVQKYLNPQPTDFIVVPAIDKQQFSVTGGINIIIDDKVSTIEQWRAAGGIGIHHAPGNSQASIEQLRHILGR